ncbi:MAG: hypothetical protein AYK18_16145 [Theionarchaea archaeon DG-70]|nr:MAG: hypothetical protein AYK18_16145 [Theionarchaea archaeon DG-70]
MNPNDDVKRTPLEICAFVITAIAILFPNGKKYGWKWSGGTYYVKIDGEWVPITKPGWDPGDEFPDNLSEDEVTT